MQPRPADHAADCPAAARERTSQRRFGGGPAFCALAGLSLVLAVLGSFDRLPPLGRKAAAAVRRDEPLLPAAPAAAERLQRVELRVSEPVKEYETASAAAERPHSVELWQTGIRPPPSAVEEGRRALARAGRVPWYDREHDTLRRLEVRPTAPPTRASAPATQASASRRGAHWLGPVLQWLGVGLLTLLLGVASAMLVRHYLHREQQETPERKVVASRREVDRVEALPITLDTTPAELLAEARRLAVEGRFSEAITYLFGYELLALDRQHVLRLARGKTNGQYLRELRSRPSLAAILKRTVQAFEAAYFGRKTIPPQTFAACWRDLDLFHAELALSPPEAA